MCVPRSDWGGGGMVLARGIQTWPGLQPPFVTAFPESPEEGGDSNLDGPRLLPGERARAATTTHAHRAPRWSERNTLAHTYLVEEDVLSVSTNRLLKVRASAKPARGTLAEPSTSKTTNVPAHDAMAQTM